MRQDSSFFITVVMTGLALLFTPGAHAQENTRKERHVWDTITILGSRQDTTVLPGSGDRVSQEEIRKHSYDDIHRILRKVPGVYVRDEEGYGLFPNISLRGVDVGRSGKVTLLEDGITIAPAPYSAPAAYYSPAAGRMSGVEVLKGSSQVKYGPHITGGVVNYLSTPIPVEPEFYLKTSGGTDKEFRGHLNFGNTVRTDWGKFGFLLEEYYRETEGFKTIDTTPDFTDGDDTGFEKTEPMFKFSWEPPDDAARYHRVEGKIGYTDLKANESYLGLTESDFDADPYRRYSASRFDNIDTEEARSYLKYLTDVTDMLSSTSTIYYNKFQRNWHKLQAVNGTNLSRVLAAGGGDLQTMKGLAAGTLTIRNNNRSYEQWGLSQEFGVDFSTGEVNHTLETGLSFHSDHIRRNQNEETYTQAGDGSASLTSVGAPGSQDNRKQEADAVRFFIRDSLDFGKLTLVPGYRYEMIDYKFIDFKNSEEGESDISVSAGGIGATYKIDDQVSLLAGVHRGYSVPGPRDNARSGIKEETSLTGELGARFTDASRAFSTEVVYFYTDFDDLLVADNVGGGGAGNTENVGDVVSQGIEWKAEYDLAIARDKSYSNPYFVSFTYTHAELDGDASSQDPESIFSGGKDGNMVPYVPEFQFTLGTGLEFEKWGLSIDGTYVDETFSTASNTESQVDANGNPDARFGKTDSFFTVDLSANFRPRDNMNLFVNLHNVTDEEYMVSRHPHGPRPGKPFTALAGLELQF